jgi:hypothetical protein
MRVVLHLCREHSQPPAWWETCTRGEQAIMLADYRIRHA